MPIKFIGREAELSLLESCAARDSASLIVIKGRRRIGKSSLVEKFAESRKFFRFAGLPPEPSVTAETQKKEFFRRLKKYFPKIVSDKKNKNSLENAQDWAELFDVLAKNTQKGQVVILLDEISWMAKGDETFLGKLKNAWDELFKQNNQLILVLCGSVSSWLEKNILSSTGFVGRVHQVITLKELPLKVCSEFWGAQKKRVSAADKLMFLSITGGVPMYLESLNPKQSVDANIKRLCFESGGLLLREFDHIFHDLFDKQSEYYKKIVLTLVGGSLCLKDICLKINVSSSGTVSEYLDDLIQAGFVMRDYTWTFKAAEPSKLSRYRLSDNYLRFYLRYLAAQKDKIERGAMAEKTLSALPEWSAMMGLQLENLVLNNRGLIWENLGLFPQDIVCDGPYFQTQTVKREGCQIDYLIQTRYNNLFVCEIKFSRHDIKTEVIKELEQKISRFEKPRNFSFFPVLIHVNGVCDTVLDSDFFAKIINISDWV